MAILGNFFCYQFSYYSVAPNINPHNSDIALRSTFYDLRIVTFGTFYGQFLTYIGYKLHPNGAPWSSVLWLSRDFYSGNIPRNRGQLNALKVASSKKWERGVYSSA